MSKPRAEFERARALLLANGFSNSAVTEMLTKRMDLRDRYAFAALSGILAGREPYPELIDEVFDIADEALEKRNG